VGLFDAYAGLILIKFAASWFIKFLDKRPGLETVAFLIVAWVGVIALSHKNVGVYCLNHSHTALAQQLLSGLYSWVSL